MNRLGVSLLVTAALTSCAPNISGRGPAGEDIPFVWNAAVQTIPLSQATETTSPEQYVTLPGCPRSAVQLRYVRQYGVETARVACLSALGQANRNAQGVGAALALPLIPLVVVVFYFMLKLFSFN